MGLSRFAEDLAPLCTLLAGVLGAAPGSGAEEASWAGPAPGCPGPRHTAQQAPALRFSPAQHFQRCYEFPHAAWLGVKPAASALLVAASSRCGRCLKGAVACPGRDAARVLLQPAPAPHSQSRDGSGAKPTSSALELVAPPVLLLLGKSAALHRCGEASPGSLVLGCPKSGVLPRSGMAEHRVPVLDPTVPCPRGCRCPAPGAGAATCLACCPKLPWCGDHRLRQRSGLPAKANSLAATRLATGLVPKPPGSATSTWWCPGGWLSAWVHGLGEGSPGQPGPISPHPCPCPVSIPSHCGTGHGLRGTESSHVSCAGRDGGGGCGWWAVTVVWGGVRLRGALQGLPRLLGAVPSHCTKCQSPLPTAAPQSLGVGARVVGSHPRSSPGSCHSPTAPGRLGSRAVASLGMASPQKPRL